MHKSVFSKAYIIASRKLLVDYYHTLVSVVVFCSFGYCVVFFPDINVRCPSVLANLLEPVAQSFVVFRHEDDVWVLLKSVCDFFAKLLKKLVNI